MLRFTVLGRGDRIPDYGACHLRQKAVAEMGIYLMDLQRHPAIRYFVSFEKVSDVFCLTTTDIRPDHHPMLS